MNRYFLLATAVVLALSFLFEGAVLPANARQDLSDPFNAGLHFMNKNDYVSAIGYFQKAVHGKYKDCSIVHYYLANALWKRGRKDDALISYAKSYLLDPTGQTASHSVRVLRHYSGRVKTIASKKELTPKVRKIARAAGIDEAALEKESKRRRPVNSTGSTVDQKQLATVKSRMPAVNVFKPGEPSLKTFSNWHWGAQAEFLPQAEARMENAKADLRNYLKTFDKAKFVASRILPKHRNHGESEADFQRRSKEQRDKYNALMQPYREGVADRTTFANETITMRNRAWLVWGQDRNIPYLAMPAAAKEVAN